MKTQITISTILTAAGGYLVTVTEPTWLPIIGGLLLAIAGALGKTAYNAYQRGRKNL